jgi:hypothetical protein
MGMRFGRIGSDFSTEWDSRSSSELPNQTATSPAIISGPLAETKMFLFLLRGAGLKDFFGKGSFLRRESYLFMDVPLPHSSGLMPGSHQLPGKQRGKAL